MLGSQPKNGTPTLSRPGLLINEPDAVIRVDMGHRWQSDDRSVDLVDYPTHRPSRLADVNRCYHPVPYSNWSKAAALWRYFRDDCLGYRDRPVSRHCATESGAGPSSFLATRHPGSRLFHQHRSFIDAKPHRDTTLEGAESCNHQKEQQIGREA